MSLAEQVGNESATEEDVIQGMIRMNQLELNTCLPGQIVSYNSVTQTCTVQPLISRTLLSGEVISRASIGEVPVVFPRSSAGGVSFPLASGDGVLIIFSQRSLEKWGVSGIESGVDDTRLHDISDAIVVPGLFPLSGSMVPPPLEATEVRGEKVFVGDPLDVITPISTAAGGLPGTLAPAAPTVIPVGKLDLVQILEAFMTLIVNCNFGGAPMTGGGGMDSVTLAAVNTLIADLTKLKA